jgi:hypothetical protein
VVTLTFQVAIMAVGTVTLCLDTFHTHGGAPAPDCPMHHQRPTRDDHHQHHAGAAHVTPPDASRIACRCSSDTLSFLISDIGVVAERISVRVPRSTMSVVIAFEAPALEMRVPPLSPPPRLSLS